MYLKLNIEDIKFELNDILKLFEERYHLNPYWYEGVGGCIYEEIREHCEKLIQLDIIHKKAFDIYKQIEDLYKLEREQATASDK